MLLQPSLKPFSVLFCDSPQILVRREEVQQISASTAPDNQSGFLPVFPLLKPVCEKWPQLGRQPGLNQSDLFQPVVRFIRQIGNPDGYVPRNR